MLILRLRAIAITVSLVKLRSLERREKLESREKRQRAEHSVKQRDVM